MNIRLPEAGESQQFADWATQNPDIPDADIKEVLAAKAMTNVVIEDEEGAALYMPLLPAVTIPYLGFRPGLSEKKKAQALRKMKEALQNLQRSLHIADAYVFTQPHYPLGKWAKKKGFQQKQKPGFTLKEPTDVL